MHICPKNLKPYNLKTFVYILFQTISGRDMDQIKQRVFGEGPHRKQHPQSPKPMI